MCSDWKYATTRGLGDHDNTGDEQMSNDPKDDNWKYTTLADRERYIRLRRMIEDHPYMSGLLCDEYTAMLDILIAHHTNGFAAELYSAWDKRKVPLSLLCSLNDLGNRQYIDGECCFCQHVVCNLGDLQANCPECGEPLDCHLEIDTNLHVYQYSH